jgi:hypothetical protein
MGLLEGRTAVINGGAQLVWPLPHGPRPRAVAL